MPMPATRSGGFPSGTVFPPCFEGSMLMPVTVRRAPISDLAPGFSPEGGPAPAGHPSGGLTFPAWFLAFPPRMAMPMSITLS
jgi:hypothetical protein